MTGKHRASPSRTAFRNRLTLVLAVAGVVSCAEMPEPLVTGLPTPIGLPPSPERKPAASAVDAGAFEPAGGADAMSELKLQPEREPGTIIGLDEAAMRARFGEPQWVEEEPPSVHWQYGSTTCTVRVFFFMEVETQHRRVLSYEITGTDDAAQSEQQCLADIASKTTG